MSAVVGLALVLAAILVGRAAKIGGQILPARWWANDNMNAFVVVPGIVAALGAGSATIISWLANGAWRAGGLESALGAAAVVAAFILLWRGVTLWALRVRPSAEVVPLAPGAADNDPRRPPGMPPMKKAA